MRAATFPEVLREQDVSSVDVLQIDTEGFDLEILKMFPFAELSPRLIKYEHGSLNPANREEAEALLTENGFVIFHEGEDTVGIRSDSLHLCSGRPR